MSDEIRWEPQSVADLAAELSRIGDQYRTFIAEIYSTFNNIGTEEKWVGKNYNTIANQILNASKSTFENWADYLQVTIPNTVYEIAERQAEIGGGSVYFSLTPNSTEIKMIDETLEKADGSQKLDPNTVKSIVSNDIPAICEEASSKLQNYYNQFQELGTLNNNAAILEMYNQLDAIITQNKAVLSEFQGQVNEAVERTIQNTVLTNEETVRIASRLSEILNF